MGRQSVRVQNKIFATSYSMEITLLETARRGKNSMLEKSYEKEMIMRKS
jgi:hypothetical protein